MTATRWQADTLLTYDQTAGRQWIRRWRIDRTPSGQYTLTDLETGRTAPGWHDTHDTARRMAEAIELAHHGRLEIG